MKLKAMEQLKGQENNILRKSKFWKVSKTMDQSRGLAI